MSNSVLALLTVVTQTTLVAWTGPSHGLIILEDQSDRAAGKDL